MIIDYIGRSFATDSPTALYAQGWRCPRRLTQAGAAPGSGSGGTGSAPSQVTPIRLSACGAYLAPHARARVGDCSESRGSPGRDCLFTRKFRELTRVPPEIVHLINSGMLISGAIGPLVFRVKHGKQEIYESKQLKKKQSLHNCKPNRQRRRKNG